MSKKKTSFQKKLKKILHSRFYQVYFGVVLLALVAMCIGRVWLNGVLVDYESSQPVYVAEKVANLFESADYETIYKLDTSASEIADGDEAFYLDSMEELTSGKDVEWSEGYSSTESERNYNVTLDGDRFATFSLVPSGETTKHGNTLWKLGSISTLVKVEATPEPTPVAPKATPTPVPGTECRIKVPNDYTVTVDGTALSSSNAAVTAKPIFEDGFLPSGVQSLTYTEYIYSTSNPTPAVEVKDPSGNVQALTQTNGTTWSCPVPGDTSLQGYSSAVLSLAKRIAKITARDASVDSMLKYCASNSPARMIFENYSNRWATPHSRTAFQNVVVSDFYMHSPTCITCHVSFDFLMATSKGTQTYPTAYTFCIVNQGGKGKLYNLLMQ